ncbi:TIGR03084 family metal-binding protein [Brevibacterium atlanticum]|uniref:TIGR03084 family metal-binding protein n=1 Tax=Brevibacterium atlanticum TaxID=2697563 RepID=UPI001421CD9C|nr:TIGR03084 family metal-binding protein [Brevibacterium atlanticum]
MTKTEIVEELCSDLVLEQDRLREVLVGLAEADWTLPTPAVNWTIHDQIAHLAHFDFITRLAISRPDRFVAVRETMVDLQTYVDLIGPANLSRTGEDMQRWWSEESSKLIDAIATADPERRVPWFGPQMSLPSKITARIMETWAHGQDIRDALGVTSSSSPNLVHVARIGALALPNSFAVRGMDVPTAAVRVELDADDGTVWSAGPEHAAEKVTGPLEDFCLVVTQRRHVADTALQTDGSTASTWMEIAQAFAGPPGPGRAPGQFAAPTHSTPDHENGGQS